MREYARLQAKNHAIEGVTQQELQEMKVQLIHVLDNNAEVSKNIHTYNFPVVIYLTSVYWLEALRIKHRTSVATFNKLFDYLEDKVQLLIVLFNHASILAHVAIMLHDVGPKLIPYMSYRTLVALNEFIINLQSFKFRFLTNKYKFVRNPWQMFKNGPNLWY